MAIHNSNHHLAAPHQRAYPLPALVGRQADLRQGQGGGAGDLQRDTLKPGSIPGAKADDKSRLRMGVQFQYVPIYKWSKNHSYGDYIPIFGGYLRCFPH